MPVLRRLRSLAALLLASILIGGAAAPAVAAQSTMVVRAYFLLDDRAGGDPALVPVLRVVPRSPAVATAALRQLLLGPSAFERGATPAVRTAIPSGTGLLGVRISNGLATVDLTGRFAAGGGSTGMFARLAQLAYTATQIPTVTRVALRLDGKPVTVFSSEGIIIERPLTRAQFRDDWLPPVFVDRPAYRAAMPDPARVTGLANVFEAVFRVRILDAGRRVLTDQRVMASCGTGCWGRFDVTLRYQVSRAQWGWLRTYTLSAKDGSVEDVREYPVWLTP
ncbi:MAG: spore gernimation protein [Chloroflexi bacterium]|nr:spore gernimation protein [Chloroflexota bacterium]